MASAVGTYSLLNAFATGAFSQVYEAKKGGLIYAVKRTDLNESREKFQTELQILKLLIGEKGVIQLLDAYEETGFGCLVFSKYQGNLKNLLDFYSPCPNRRSSFRYYVPELLRQILIGLQTCHKKGIIHRDLKPQNILFRSSTDYKSTYQLSVCDFGQSLPPGSKWDEKTRYCTSWYCAPEYYDTERKVPLGPAMDVWSVGCIFYQLVEMKTLFASWNEDDQPALIKQVLSWDLDDLCPHMDENGFDLFSNLIQVDPSKRISVEEALKHPYLKVS